MQEKTYYTNHSMGQKRHSQKAKALSRKRAARMKRRIAFFVLLLFVAVCSFSLGSVFSSARETRGQEPVYFKYYKDIQVKEGDTLHKLAEKYNIGTQYSDREYVRELRTLNHMKSSSLIPGQSLLIMYYDTEYK